ncbi:MAG: HD domain-containing protein [Lachnospiraceae bacterium]|nr:HD domain-containing protein [Lachnospiraceae bacterium]
MVKKVIELDEFKAGMVSDEDIYSKGGMKLILADTELDDRMIHLLKISGVKKIRVKYYEQFPEDMVTFLHMRRDFQEVVEKFSMFHVSIDIKKFLRRCDELLLSEEENYVIFEALKQLKEDSYVNYMHSIGVSVLSYFMGVWCNMDQYKIDLLGACGLVHDIGKCEIPPELLNKKETITSTERSTLHRHTVIGHRFMSKLHVPKEVEVVVMEHHERGDGSGYPMGFKLPQISDFARIVGIVDVYEAMVSDRPYRGEFCPFEVVRFMEAEGEHKFDSTYLSIFLSKLLEAYIHAKVRLSDGSEGEIMVINKSYLSKPIVKILGRNVDLSLKKDVEVVKVISV